ncbi:glycosyltransferase family 25 protein [Pseudoroseicyclus tamaricis]|uniref:Glycosyltransferase family 25 protein n=1 Tax=Pseudoroseicyclus tamaricis TaxID=2705421 RepID=A0A6B2JNI1_9RHOB|nr:glycosyltransferase family 25 protein [Pseudoroseicyclus tamaricis]NDU99539.1 glycosyltransferase family 25 protein [Pseudoroseicyclus tamaricis]
MKGEETGAALVRLFPRIHVINLASRADRRREIDAQLRRIGLSLEHEAVRLFPAARPDDRGEWESIGARGCFLSHLSLLRQIAKGDAPAALILEDDCDFTPALGRGLAALETTPWDMVYGHVHGWGDAGGLPEGAIPCPPEAEVRTSHFIGITRDAAARAAPYLEAITRRPYGDPAGGPMHVDGAYTWWRRSEREMPVVCLSPPAARQRPSRTDIQPHAWYDRLPALAMALQTARRLKHRLGG